MGQPNVNYAISKRCSHYKKKVGDHNVNFGCPQFGYKGHQTEALINRGTSARV